MKNRDNQKRQKHFTQNLFKEIFKIPIYDYSYRDSIPNKEEAHLLYTIGNYEYHVGSLYIIIIKIPLNSNQKPNTFMIHSIIKDLNNVLDHYLADNWDADSEKELIEGGRMYTLAFKLTLPHLTKMMFNVPYKNTDNLGNKSLVKLKI